MPTRGGVLRLRLGEGLQSGGVGAWSESTIPESQLHPNAPFAEAGAALRRLLAAGADRRDICLVARLEAYEAIFSLLYMLDDPGVDDGQVFMLCESLLGADPSGKEGRPG